MTPKRILLAEDDQDDQAFFLEFLRNRPDVQLLPPVDDGEALFEYLERAGNTALPDAIILDQNMPKRNGLQTLALLKQSLAYAHIPVLVYSTYADETLRQRSTAQGAALVASKPSDMQGYHNMMDQFLGAM